MMFGWFRRRKGIVVVAKDGSVGWDKDRREFVALGPYKYGGSDLTWLVGAGFVEATDELP